MKDKKFAVALVIIIILLTIIAFILLINPAINGYVVSKQIDAQKITVESIAQIAVQQGYVLLNFEDKTVRLVTPEYLMLIANQQGYIVLNDGTNQVVLITEDYLKDYVDKNSPTLQSASNQFINEGTISVPE
jgi:hypothetical protein